ncbi:aspartate aminotransferase family protein [Gryllotalpicola protaetiae]|uniref:Aspartate aminotransferase family protein n=1 Tax=Gryllotalpicola protaetiae TaxID=2419771 RepID=A0A387BHG9_9MICO|nr:aspartate aminotransferase family protein [Gryllotalpicola protaetiae]AYG03273.1 aspartate aminotransferase family protein [Gryllotalpicola protaetiae]
MTELDPADQQLARDLDRAHVFHSWSAQGALNPLVFAGGEGARLWDFEGTQYLDMSSQLVNVNIGYQHPKVVAAIKAQADVLTTIDPKHANLARGRAAQLIVEKANLTGAEFEKVFFTNGGADANENAIRLARLYTGRDTVLSTYRSYHGNTGAAIVATGDWRRMPNQYARGHVHFFGPYLYRSEFWAETEEQESERALHHLERVIQAEGPDTIAALLIETVPGTAGILVPPPGYLEGVRELATRYGIVLIADEVMAGFGRTGEWFAHQGFGVTPDLITFAKGVNSGYVPMGGVIIPPAIAHAFDERVFPGGLTYSGHPLAAASVVATIEAMTDEGIVENAKRIGDVAIGPALDALKAKHPELIGEVRGLGCFWAMELVADAASRAPLPDAVMAGIRSALVGRGVLPFVQNNRIHVVPPLVVTEGEISEAFGHYDAVLSEIRLS